MGMAALVTSSINNLSGELAMISKRSIAFIVNGFLVVWAMSYFSTVAYAEGYVQITSHAATEKGTFWFLQLS